MLPLNLTLKVAVLFFFTFFSALLSAQENYLSESPDTLASQTIPEVVVTANRHGTPELKTPEAIGVIVNENIQKFQLRSAPRHCRSPRVFLCRKPTMEEDRPFYAD